MKVKEIVFTVFKDYFNSSLPSLHILDSQDKAEMLDTYYKVIHSGEKTILPSLESRLESIPSLIALKFANKWNKVYDTLVQAYDPLKDYNVAVDRKDTESVNKSNSVNGTDSTVEDNTRNDSSKQSTDLSTTTNDANQNNVFGFNSDSEDGQPASKDNGLTTETVVGTGDKNKTDTDTRELNNTDKNYSRLNTGSKDSQGTRLETKSGLLKNTSQKLAEDEIRLRAFNNTIDIICLDLDSLITLSVY